VSLSGHINGSCSCAGRLAGTPGTPIATTPSLNIFQDPATLDWQPIVKVEHYRLKQDSIRHPVELKEDSIPYKTGDSE
jgi:hypothetical protein